MKKLLLIQIRDNPKIAKHEEECIVDCLDDSNITIDSCNIYSEKFNLKHDIHEYYGVIVGGSHLCPKDSFPQKEILYKFMDEIIRLKIPFLGICFGFELLVLRSGGELIMDKENMEFGTKEIVLSDKGKKDLLYSNLDTEISVQLGHEYRAISIGDDLDVLASGKDVYYQSVQYKDELIYGVQFHPELNDIEFMKRVNLYHEGNRFMTADMLGDLYSSPDSKKIVANFGQYIMNEKWAKQHNFDTSLADFKIELNISNKITI